MKTSSITFLAVALFTPATFLACAGGAETSIGGGGVGGVGGTGGAGGTDTVTTSTSTTSTTSTSTTSTTTTTTTTNTSTGCVPTCASDADCQNSCPAVATGANCCDTSIGICYVATSAVCPSPNDGGTGATMPY